MSFMDKAKDLAQQARGKAEEAAEKAGPNATKGLHTAKEQLNKATGGKYQDKIETASGHVEGFLNRNQQSADPGQQSDQKRSAGDQQPGQDNTGGSTGQPPQS